MFIVENILDLIADYGEKVLMQLLDSFSCPKNPEIELFLKKMLFLLHGRRCQ